MKKLLAILFVVVFAGIMVSGCGKIKSTNANTVVTISRSVDFTLDPVLYIACGKATIDYEKRAVVIEGVVSISGEYGKSQGNWVVKKMEIQDKNLIIHIPDDVTYEVHIGPRYICFNSKNWKEGKIEDQ